jgi:hypothetical protein
LHGPFRCWREPDRHKGGNPARLVQVLLGCSFEHAQRIVGHNVNIPSNLSARVRSLFQPPPQRTHPHLTLPTCFKQLNHKSVLCRPFIHYLSQRGFTSLPALNRRGLHYATTGPFRGRIIFPIYHDDQLVNWTGRTIYPSEPIRYKTLRTDEAVGSITDYLLWYDELMKTDANTIVLVEGPFDALKVMSLGQRHGIVATCFFTSTASATQVDLLHSLLPHFDRRFLLLDQGTLPKALAITSRLRDLGVQRVNLPRGISDPGSLENEEQLLKLLWKKIC